MLYICNFFTITRLMLTSGLLSFALLGCSTSQVTKLPAEPKEVSTVPSNWVPVARYGRYTLVELAPKAAQQNLLLQVIDVSIPATPPPTIGDALHYVLQHSGYSLCEDNAEVTTLLKLPLPAAHQHLGPLFLRDALLTLAGPAWELDVNNAARQVCFSRRVEPLP